MATKSDSDEMRRRELAAFLTKKRKCLAPPRRVHASQRRLTPGLRREEVAESAGVGTTWYTWLEQARDIRPSERTLRRIARALKLDKPETKYLLDLGLDHRLRPSGDEPVAREVMLILKAISTPAYLLGRTGNLLAYNGAANALFDFDYMPGPNYFKVLFAPPARALFANWAEYARHAVAVFRTRNADALGDPAVVDIIAELSRQSHEFAEWWAEHAVSALRAIKAAVNHPFIGHLEFDNACMRVEEHPGLSLIAFITEHEETRQGLSELVRQLERGEHDATHNVWNALSAYERDPGRDAYHSQHQ